MQGRLREESISFVIDTECACCNRAIKFTMLSDLSYTLDNRSKGASPMVYIPQVDFTKLNAPSIVDDF